MMGCIHTFRRKAGKNLDCATTTISLSFILRHIYSFLFIVDAFYTHPPKLHTYSRASSQYSARRQRTQTFMEN